MQVLNKVAIRNEQHVTAFTTDVKNCHGFSISNLGTSVLRFRLLSDPGTVTLFPSEAMDFTGVGHVPFVDDSLEGEFELAEGEAEEDRVDLIRITKYIGQYIDC